MKCEDCKYFEKSMEWCYNHRSLCPAGPDPELEKRIEKLETRMEYAECHLGVLDTIQKKLEDVIKEMRENLLRKTELREMLEERIKKLEAKK